MATLSNGVEQGRVCPAVCSVKIFIAFLLTISLSCLVFAQRPDPSLYARMPSTDWIHMSPDGTKLAVRSYYHSDQGDNVQINVINLTNGEVTVPFSRDSAHYDVNYLTWVDNERFILDYRWFERLWSTSEPSVPSQELIHFRDGSLRGSDFSYRYWGNILHRLPEEPGHILSYRGDLVKRGLLEGDSGDVLEVYDDNYWVVDAEGNTRLEVELFPLDTVEIFHQEPDGSDRRRCSSLTGAQKKQSTSWVLIRSKGRFT